MFKKLAVLVLCFAMVSAHAGWIKKALVVGGIAYAGNAVAKKVKANKEKKAQENAQNPQKVQPSQATQQVDREIQR